MYRGQFKFRTPNGSQIMYNIKDIVIEQGRAYECQKYTSQSPLQKPSHWKATSLSEVYKGPNPPVNPIENQLWMADTGTLYIWYKDQNGFQWIQI